MGRRRTIARIALTAAAAAFLNGEYYKYGLTLFLQPLLFALYLAYATMAEDLIRRFGWGSRELFGFGAVFGLVMEGFMTRSFYADPPLVLGVNWLTVAIQVLYWGLATSVLAFYVSGRLLPRTAAGPMLPPAGWALVGAWWVALLAVWNAALPPLRSPGAIPIAAIAAAGAAALVLRSRRVRGRAPGRPLARSVVLDAAIGVALALELVVGTARSLLGPAGAAAPSPAVIWTWIAAGVALSAVAGPYAFGSEGVAV